MKAQFPSLEKEGLPKSLRLRNLRILWRQL